MNFERNVLGCIDADFCKLILLFVGDSSARIRKHRMLSAVQPRREPASRHPNRPNIVSNGSKKPHPQSRKLAKTGVVLEKGAFLALEQFPQLFLRDDASKKSEKTRGTNPPTYGRRKLSIGFRGRPRPGFETSIDQL